MSWKEFISRNFGAVITTAVIGVVAAFALAWIMLESVFIWGDPAKLIDIHIRTNIRYFDTWLFVLFVNVSLLALTSVIVAIKPLPDAIIDSITTRDSTLRSTSWIDSLRRAITAVKDVKLLDVNALGMAGVLLFVGFVGMGRYISGEVLHIETGLGGAACVIAGLVLVIIGIYAVTISSITNSVADHMPESDEGFSHIPGSESMRLASILTLSLVAIWIAGGSFLGVGMNIAASATQGIELLILTGAPMMILGNAGMVVFIRRFSSSIADHVSDDSIGITASPNESDFHLFFQFLAVQILAAAPLLFGIATINTGSAYLLWGIAAINTDGDSLLVWLWIWSWPAILIFVLGSLAVTARHVSNSVAAIVSRRAEIAARRQ